MEEKEEEEEEEEEAGVDLGIFVTSSNSNQNMYKTDRITWEREIPPPPQKNVRLNLYL